MAYHLATTAQSLPVPANLLANFIDPVDCLTAHLMFECSEVLAGAKPANLISLVNRTRTCGRNIYQLWQQHHVQAIQRLGSIECLPLQIKERSLLLLCFNRKNLEQQLAHAGIRTLLQKAGYHQHATLDALLSALKLRLSEQDGFPHEIGLFIGYPAKDVAAFMGLIKLPFACQGLWKIFGNPDQSLCLAEQYRFCRQRMSAVLAAGNKRALQLKNPEHPFFCALNNNDHQI